MAIPDHEDPGAAGPEPLAILDGVRPGRGLGRTGRIAQAVAECMFASEAGPPPAHRIAWLVADLDHFIGHAGGRTRFILGLGLRAIQHLAPLYAWRPLLPFTWLGFETRARALERLERSVFGLAVFGVKALLCTLYYEHPDAAREVGYEGGGVREPASAASSS